MTTKFRPMKGEPAILDQLVFPYYATPKFDGIRCVVREGRALTSALKPQPNAYVRNVLEHPEYEGFDGELIVGPHDADVFRRTTSELRRAEGEPDFTFHVFDLCDEEYRADSAEYRWMVLRNRLKAELPRVALVQPRWIGNHVELRDHFNAMLLDGYEGLMLRSPGSPYKHGKATVKQNWLLKYKPFEDCEVQVLDVIEAMENTNEKRDNERGLAQRSSHKDGKVPKGTMGALSVRALNGKYAGLNFEVGTGFTADDRARFWALRFAIRNGAEQVFGTVRYDLAGGYDKPRFPSWKGERMTEDMA